MEKVEKLLFSISEQSQETAAMTCWEIATNFYKEVKLTTFLILYTGDGLQENYMGYACFSIEAHKLIENLIIKLSAYAKMSLRFYHSLVTVIPDITSDRAHRVL